MSTRPSVTRDPVHAGVEVVDRIRRGAELAGRATVRGFVEFYESDSLTFAASIAYYSLLSLFPFLLLVLTVLGKVAAASQTPAGPALLHLVNSALPRQFDFIGTQLQDWLPHRCT